MEIYRTENGQVTKYIHDDGSETAVKFIGSCSNEVGLEPTARNKYTVFISISSGCKMKCKFCYLTAKKCGYTPLNKHQIKNNLKEAIDDVVKFNPSLKKKYIKLSWMGMGDALPHDKIVYDVTIKMLDYIFHKGYAKGLDGVDLATVYPKKSDLSFFHFKFLADDLEHYNKNPDHDDGRHMFRIFYSLHNVKDVKRAQLIPATEPVEKAVLNLRTLSYFERMDLIFHHMFLDGINDSQEDLNNLIQFMNKVILFNSELRILRFNECPNTDYKETKKFNFIIDLLSKTINKFKYQISTGSEIKAACGQFLLKDLTNI